MSPSKLPQRASEAVGQRLAGSNGTRRNFLIRVAAAGSAFMIGPVRFLLYPSSAWAGCPQPGGCTSGQRCADGYSAFCCGLNGGTNNCPSGTAPGGWWYACIPSSYCNTQHRYYVDCVGNCAANCGNCQCKDNSCANRVVCCNIGYHDCAAGSSTRQLRCRIMRCVNPCVSLPNAGCPCGNAHVDQGTVSHEALSCGVTAPAPGSYPCP